MGNNVGVCADLQEQAALRIYVFGPSTALIRRNYSNQGTAILHVSGDYSHKVSRPPISNRAEGR